MTTCKPRSKKRKLPANLSEAEALLQSSSSAKSLITDACKVLQSVKVDAVEGVPGHKSLSPDETTVWLIARYGIQRIYRMCQILNSIPSSITQMQRVHYFRSFTGIKDDATAIMARIEQSSLLTTFQQQSGLSVCNILAPPMNQCQKCSKSLVQNHSCNVIIYTTNGVLHAEKVTLRCVRCNLYYNYDKWGNKGELGFSFYHSAREFVEVNDTTYFHRQLLEFQCSLANHSWISFQGFGESYSDAFSLSKGELMSAKIVAEAFYNGEIENENRFLVNEDANLQLEDFRMMKDSDREVLLERIEAYRSNTIYHHHDHECTQECKQRGCGTLWVTDGIWKLTFPHCMHRVQYIVEQIPALSMPDVCTNQPMPGKAFCQDHYKLLQAQSPPVPTDLQGFLQHCKVLKDITQDTQLEEASDEQEKKIEYILQQTSSDMGQSAATSQGTYELLSHHPLLLSKESMSTDFTTHCRKDTGQTKRLRRWSRGHQFIVRAGGHIEAWQPLYKSESPSQVFFILLQWLATLINSGSLKEGAMQNIFLAYDNMCNVCRLRVARDPLPLPPPMDKAWLQINKIIDKFHLPNHINPQCHKLYTPQPLKDRHPDANTQAGEQTFVWLGRYKHILCAMNKTHHLFYLHRMIRRRNAYTAKCYATGRKPILPKAHT